MEWLCQGAMGTVTHLARHRDGQTRGKGAGRFVFCAHCGERHPVVRLAGGARRCVTAFLDDGRWFCRNRGCRAAWFDKHHL